MTQPAKFNYAGYAVTPGWAPLPYPYRDRRTKTQRGWSPRCAAGRHAWPLRPEPDVDIAPLCARCGLWLRWYRVGDHGDGQARNTAVAADVLVGGDPLDDIDDTEWYSLKWSAAAGLARGATPVPLIARFPGLAGNPRAPRHPRRNPRRPTR